MYALFIYSCFCHVSSLADYVFNFLASAIDGMPGRQKSHRAGGGGGLRAVRAAGCSFPLRELRANTNAFHHAFLISGVGWVGRGEMKELAGWEVWVFCSQGKEGASARDIEKKKLTLVMEGSKKQDYISALVKRVTRLR